jgi:hypothetical protein
MTICIKLPRGYKELASYTALWLVLTKRGYFTKTKTSTGLEEHLFRQEEQK